MDFKMLFRNPISYYPATNFSLISNAFILFPSSYNKH